MSRIIERDGTNDHLTFDVDGQLYDGATEIAYDYVSHITDDFCIDSSEILVELDGKCLYRGLIYDVSTKIGIQLIGTYNPNEDVFYMDAVKIEDDFTNEWFNFEDIVKLKPS